MLKITRLLQLPDINHYSTFLFGPRQTGKSSLLKTVYPLVHYLDLLNSDVLAAYLSEPALLRKQFAHKEFGPNQPRAIIIDEIQKAPPLLDEAHWLIENAKINFIFTGSSARKIRRGKANLLGGRAITRELRPLTSSELPEINLEHIFHTGLLPKIYLSSLPDDLLRSYITTYLKEEILDEGLTRNFPAFSSFLQVAALSSGGVINYTNIAREVGQSAKTVKGYFEILIDTLLGTNLEAWTKVKKRRAIEKSKFYLFDIGVKNFLCKQRPALGTPEFGHSLEHFIFQELLAYKSYKKQDIEMTYFRTTSGFEVDFILNDLEVAIEVKSSRRIDLSDCKGLRALSEERPIKRRIVVALIQATLTYKDKFGAIEVMPWQEFLSKLWGNQIL